MECSTVDTDGEHALAHCNVILYTVIMVHAWTCKGRSMPRKSTTWSCHTYSLYKYEIRRNLPRALSCTRHTHVQGHGLRAVLDQTLVIKKTVSSIHSYRLTSGIR